jgi:dolichyl-phosphate beta-glucosyltransferase
MTLSVVIPAYNEENRIAGTLEQLFAEAETFGIHEIIVVDDGSLDNTADVIRGVGKGSDRLSLRLIQHEQNSGKGAALRTGLVAATGSLVGFVDADLSVDAEAFTRALPLLERGADMVVGKRVASNGKGTRFNQPLNRRVLGHIFVTVQRGIVGLRFQDTQCPFKVLTRAAVEQLVPKCRVNGWAFDVELLRVAMTQSMQIVEIPVHWSHVEGSRVRSSPLTALNTVRDLISIRRTHHAE